jgi:phage-related protein
LRQLEEKVWEIRVGKHRIAYVVVSGPELILLHAFKKLGRRTPRTDLDLALKRAREVLGEKTKSREPSAIRASVVTLLPT